MIFQQIDFHYVEQMIPWENGYHMARLPETVFQRVNQGIRERSGFYSTGIELRFRLNSDSVDLWLRAMPELEAQVAYLFYGSIQGGWQCPPMSSVRNPPGSICKSLTIWKH